MVLSLPGKDLERDSEFTCSSITLLLIGVWNLDLSLCALQDKFSYLLYCITTYAKAKTVRGVCDLGWSSKEKATVKVSLRAGKTLASIEVEKGSHTQKHAAEESKGKSLIAIPVMQIVTENERQVLRGKNQEE